MCGIAGFVGRDGLQGDAEERALRMLASIRYRGPDEYGVYLDNHAVLGSVRLSIVDVAGGQQPIANEDETLWIVFNGEVFNHRELRRELIYRGHRFATYSDTEVVLHLFEELGPGCLDRLNGQFAIAVWDSRRRELFLARDRLGVRPLFYVHREGTLYFGSEIKALFNAGGIAPRIDVAALCDVFTYWATRPGTSIFEHVQEIPPAHYMLAGPAGVKLERYWSLRFDAPAPGTPAKLLEEHDAVAALEAMLVDATNLRLQADVPVGAYLSGGLDSSMIAALGRSISPTRLRTFSIAFADDRFDERSHQQRMAQALGTAHEVVEATHEDIGRLFPEVVWHLETPTLRTAPVPMYLLSRCVRDAGFKVVLTGEGADEFLGGYDIFKEASVRAYWARDPDSTCRPHLLTRLYPDIFGDGHAAATFLAEFFREGLTETQRNDYSHVLRWRNTRRTWRFLSPDVRAQGARPPADALADLLPAGLSQWPLLARAQWFEAALFLPQYLLSSQGDRVAMGHSVEARYPFLDHRVVEFCNGLPPRFKLQGLRDKRVLRAVAGKWLPPSVAARRKRPYRAPIHRSFFHARTPRYVPELLAEPTLRSSGLFEPTAVAGLHARLVRGGTVGETDDMALAGILSTQLLHQLFVERFAPADAGDLSGPGKFCRRATRVG